MTRTWHLDDPQYTRIVCDANGCADDITIPSVSTDDVAAVLTDAGWKVSPRDIGGYVVDEDFCPRHGDGNLDSLGIRGGRAD